MPFPEETVSSTPVVSVAQKKDASSLWSYTFVGVYAVSFFAAVAHEVIPVLLKATNSTIPKP